MQAAFLRDCLSGMGLKAALSPLGAPHLAATFTGNQCAAVPPQQPASQQPTSQQAATQLQMAAAAAAPGTAALAQALRRVAVLEKQLQARDQVIGELSRSRDDACARRLASLEAAVRDAHRSCAYAVAALAAQRKQYAALVDSLMRAVAELEAGDLPPCSCCSGCPGVAAGLALFSEAADVAKARERAAYFQEQAADWQLTCSHQDVALSEAAAEIDHLQCCLARQEEATVAAEVCAAAAKAALAACQQVGGRVGSCERGVPVGERRAQGAVLPACLMLAAPPPVPPHDASTGLCPLTSPAVPPLSPPRSAGGAARGQPRPAQRLCALPHPQERVGGGQRAQRAGAGM